MGIGKLLWAVSMVQSSANVVKWAWEDPVPAPNLLVGVPPLFWARAPVTSAGVFGIPQSVFVGVNPSSVGTLQLAEVLTHSLLLLQLSLSYLVLSHVSALHICSFALRFMLN